jgi:hypothetical protein
MSEQARPRSAVPILAPRPGAQSADGSMRSKQSRYEELRDYLLNGGNIAEIEAYDLRFLKLHILDYVQECRRSYTMEIADRCVQLFEQIRPELSDRESANAVKVRARQQTDLAEFDQDWDARDAKLKQEHKGQWIGFNDFSTSVRLDRYKSPSPGLLQLKQIERSAILTHDSIKAKQIAREIQNRTQLELERQQRWLDTEHHEQQRQLLA